LDKSITTLIRDTLGRGSALQLAHGHMENSQTD